MQLVDKVITVAELKQLARNQYGTLVKAVVDIEKNLLVVDAVMHADEEQWLLQQGSKQADLWGINLYPDNFGKENFIEFDSMINLRPGQTNKSRGVDDPAIREKIIDIVSRKITP